MFALLFFMTSIIIYLILAVKRSRQYGKNLAGILISFLVLCICTSCGPKSAAITSSDTSNKNSTSPVVTGTASAVSGKLIIHYINVGQGDSILVQQDGRNMLIDTGTNESTGTLINYLHSQNVKRIDYLILTHAHEDHIGGADAVINDFNIGTIYMTKYITSTRTFKDVISAMKSKGLKAALPIPGNTFRLGSADCIILGPVNADGRDLNTCSAVIKLTFGNTRFLFTGDAQSSNEEAMINKGYDLTADVLKAGHHGSRTSTCEEFLDAVNPKYAVISAGKGNDYGHPHKQTMERLRAKGVKVYRTDESGTIICTSDGRNISFSCNPGDYAYGNSAGTNVSSGTDKPVSSGNISVSAAISNPSPAQNTEETLTVKGQPGASFKAVCHYSSTVTAYRGTIGNPLSFKIGRAKKGYKVIIDITVMNNGKTYKTQTSFTPE